jgi:hypothetical protein
LGCIGNNLSDICSSQYRSATKFLSRTCAKSASFLCRSASTPPGFVHGYSLAAKTFSI